MERITREHVRELLESGAMEPTLIQWPDTGEIEVVPAPNFTDIIWSERGSEYTIIADAASVRTGYEYDPEHLTDEDCEAIAEHINDTREA